MAAAKLNIKTGDTVVVMGAGNIDSVYVGLPLE